MASDIDQPNSFVQQQNTDASQYVPYTTPTPARPRCYYCGEPSLAGSTICKRCSDWINDRAQNKARLSFRLGLAAILTLVTAIVFFVGSISANKLDRTLSRVIYQISIYMFPASIVLGGIAIASGREAKKLAYSLRLFNANEQAGLLRASKLGVSAGIVSIVLFFIFFLVAAAFAILLIMAFFAMP
jgi:hypothetical protein